ncbi:MAG: amino acid permease [archaeon]
MAELKKSLGYITIIALSITALIGTGIFFGPALAAKYAGKASIWAWIILGFVSVYVATCFGELASMYPKAGGVYEFSKHAYGRFPSFLIGWTTWMVSNITTTLIIVAAVNYLLPTTIPFYKLIACIALIVVLNIVAFRGIDESSAVVIFFSIVIIAVILGLVIPGSTKIVAENIFPLTFTNPLLILLALFFIVETYFGWESATFLAEETNNAERVIPRSLVISSIIVAVLGFASAFVMLGIIPAGQLAQLDVPLASVANIIFGSQGELIVRIGVFLALIGSAAGGIVSLPRLLLALARDKLFLQQLADIHPVYKTPYKAIIFQLIVSLLILFIGFGNYSTLLSLLVPLALIMYITVLFAVPLLRWRKPQHERPFRAPLGSVLPLLVILLYAVTIAAWLFLDPGAIGLFKIALSLIFLGIPVYLLLLFHYEPETIIKANNSIAYMNLWLENALLPKSVRKELLGYFKTLHQKTVLEFGTGVGTMTVHLAEEVGPKGRIIATELSDKNVDILKKRLVKRGISNVQVIYDKHQVNRLHPDIKKTDVVISVGMLSYMQDVNKVLREINAVLPKNAEICFAEYVDFFWVLPNVGWLSSEQKIKKTFRDAGFAVRVKKRKGLLWNYLIVYGIKSEEDVPYI